MGIYTVMSTPQLVEANEHAVEMGQNRAVTDEFIAMLDPEGTHVVAFSMPHTNHEGTEGMRCRILCKVKSTQIPQEAWVDVSWDDWSRLDKVEATPASA